MGLARIVIGIGGLEYLSKLTRYQAGLIYDGNRLAWFLYSNLPPNIPSADCYRSLKLVDRHYSFVVDFDAEKGQRPSVDNDGNAKLDEAGVAIRSAKEIDLGENLEGHSDSTEAQMPNLVGHHHSEKLFFSMQRKRA